MLRNTTTFPPRFAPLHSIQATFYSQQIAFLKSRDITLQWRHTPQHRHTGFKAVSTGWQGDTGEQDNTNHIPLSLDGRGIKEPVPVLDTGSEGEIKTPTPLRYCTQTQTPTKRGDAAPINTIELKTIDRYTHIRKGKHK